MRDTEAETAVRRPFEAADVNRSAHVGDAVLSPDGGFAVYELSEFVPGASAEEDRQASSLWRIDLEAGAARRLTRKGGGAASPRMSPDGAFLYYLASREGAKVAQIWRLPLDGGEAEPLTSLEQGVGVFAVSPDGETIAYAAAEALKPRRPNEHVRISRAAWRFDPVPGYLHDLGQAISLLPSAGGVAEALTAYDGIVQAIDWSPSGGELAALILGRAETEAFPALGDLVIVDEAGNATTLVRRIFAATLFWTPDGRKVGYVAGPPGAFSRQPQLFVVDREGGEPEVRTRALDRAVGGLFQTANPAARVRTRVLPAPGGDSAVTAIGVGGEGGLWEVALTGPEQCRPLLTGPKLRKALGRNGDKVLFSAQDFIAAPELWLFDLATGTERQLTEHNSAWRASVAWPKAERMTAASGEGAQIEGWVLLPAQGEPPFKTLLFIHGGPHGAWGASFNEDFQEMAGAGYAVAFANPRGSTGYGDEFSTAILGRWGEPELEDFTAFLDALVARGIADPHRLGVTGVSGGGHLSAWLIGHTDRFKAAVPEQGIYSHLSAYGVSDAGVELMTHELGAAPHEEPRRYWELSPLAHAHKCRTPTLLIQGEADVRCPMEQAEQLYTVLRRNGCAVELLRLAGCNHGLQVWGPPGLRRTRMAAMREWFDRYLV
ncbi:MAG TPA: S9 family peptidase [Caulobacteraceae bacterium]|nr:S9 family peptidase [Caulobacteraceae bacterium]